MPLSELLSIHQLLPVTETVVFRWSCVRELIAMLYLSLCFVPRAAFVCLPWPDSWFLVLGLCVLVFDCHIGIDSLCAVWCIGFPAFLSQSIIRISVRFACSYFPLRGWWFVSWHFFLGTFRLWSFLSNTRVQNTAFVLHLPYLVLLSISFPLSKDLELLRVYFQIQTSLMKCVPEFSVTNQRTAWSLQGIYCLPCSVLDLGFIFLSCFSDSLCQTCSADCSLVCSMNFLMPFQEWEFVSLFPILGQNFKASSFSLSSVLLRVKGSTLRNHWGCLFAYPEFRLSKQVNHQISHFLCDAKIVCPCSWTCQVRGWVIWLY